MRSLILSALLGLMACAPEAPPERRPPVATTPPASRPAPTAGFNPLDTGVATTPGSGSGGY